MHNTYKGYCIGPFGFPMLEDDARALDKELETSEEEIGSFKLFKGFDKANYFSDGERADVSVITDESVDEDGEVIELKSMDFGPLRKNPIVTFNHNYDMPPIGKSIWQKQVGTSIKAKTIYAPRPDTLQKDIEWFPDSIFGLVKSGFLPGKSVGGFYKKRAPTTEELQKFGPTLKRVGHSAKIIEYSVVTRQANNKAIVEAVSKSLIKISPELIGNLPEVAELLKEYQDKIKKEQEELPVIKSYRTPKDVEADIEKQMQEFYDKTPELVDDIFARLLGKV